jgi:hypothetical protein
MLTKANWVLGFLSGIGFVNANQSDPLHGLDAEAVQAWLDTYCRNYPLDPIINAAKGLYFKHPQ